jgi:hypothetical protein
MNRALRRFYAQRWKNRAKRFWYFRWEFIEDKNAVLDPRNVGISARTPQRCSLWYCCGNPRKRQKGEQYTIQEKRQLNEYHEQLKEYGL